MATATTHVLSFVGTDLAGGDNTVFIDNVRIGVVSNSIVKPAGLNAIPGNMQANLTWNPSVTATSYNVKRSNAGGGPYAIVSNIIVTNYTDVNLTNGLTYYYVVSALNQIGESADSATVIATPVATNAVSLMYGWTDNSLTLGWPADHKGWQLQAQTNTMGSGLGTNWVDVSGSKDTNQIMLPIDAANSSVFYRLIYQ